MKTSFEGKGGSGKSSLCNLMARYMAGVGKRVLLVDADVNQAQAGKLGMVTNPGRWFGAGRSDQMGTYLGGENPYVRSIREAGLDVPKMVPPGPGSRIIGHGDRLLGRFVQPSTVRGIGLIDPGPLDDDRRGVNCWHYNLGAIERTLVHLVERDDEHTLVDMTAGDDEATALHSLFDVRLFVAEPTKDSMKAAKDMISQARHRGHAYLVVANQVEDSADLEALNAWVAEVHDADPELKPSSSNRSEVDAVIPMSAWVKAVSKGRSLAGRELEAEVVAGLEQLAAKIDGVGRHGERRINDAARICQANVEGTEDREARRLLLEPVRRRIESGALLDVAGKGGVAGVLTSDTLAVLRRGLDRGTVARQGRRGIERLAS